MNVNIEDYFIPIIKSIVNIKDQIKIYSDELIFILIRFNVTFLNMGLYNLSFFLIGYFRIYQLRRSMYRYIYVKMLIANLLH